MKGNEELKGAEMTDKQTAIDSIVGETRKELSEGGLQSFFDIVKDFVSSFQEDPIKALQNLFTEVKEGNSTHNIQKAASEIKPQHTEVTKLDTKKPLESYTEAETKKLFTSIFGPGLATDTFLYLTKNSPVAMKRTLALARHEGGFNFSIRNLDPNRKSGQKNYSTFQLSAKNLPEKLSASRRGFKKLLSNTPFTSENFDTVYEAMNERQQNLALWLGHIMSRPQPYKILEDLSNPNLSDNEVVTLMSRRIQGGIEKIGHSVVAQTKTATAGHFYATMSKSGYSPIESTTA